MKYRKKPIVVEAIQWDGTHKSYLEIIEKFSDMRSNAVWNGTELISKWIMETLEGEHEVSKWDYIIEGVKKEYYPCKPDIFELTYEAVE